jgi:hypothetical protein
MGFFMRSLLTLSLALLTALVLGAQKPLIMALATSPENTAPSASLECAAGHPLRIALPQTFERIPSENPAVLCIFRNKTDGFPTLNVVVEPRLEGVTPPSLAEYEEGIRRGYEGVGLTDARLSGAAIGESNGLPFFTTEVFFTNNARAMAAQILVVQLHDRTYTASAVGYAKPGDSELRNLIGTILIEGTAIDLAARPPFRWQPIAAGVLATLAIGLLYQLGRKRVAPTKTS